MRKTPKNFDQAARDIVAGINSREAMLKAGYAPSVARRSLKDNMERLPNLGEAIQSYRQQIGMGELIWDTPAKVEKIVEASLQLDIAANYGTAKAHKGIELLGKMSKHHLFEPDINLNIGAFSMPTDWKDELSEKHLGPPKQLPE